MHTAPHSLDDVVKPSTDDVLRDLALKIRSLEHTLRLMQEARIDYNPIPPYK